MSRFIVVPQWQGSPSSRAMTLIDGADAIAGDLPRSSCAHVDVPLEAGDEIGTGIRRASSLRHTRRETIERIAASAEPAVVIGGDVGVAVWAIDALAGDGDLAVAWFGAAAPLQAPGDGEPGAFEPMALSAVLGCFDDELALAPGRVSPRSVVLAGARDIPDPAAVADSGVAVVDADAVGERPESVAEALAPGGASRVFVHVSLDVLDPAELAGVAMPSPFGVGARALGEAIAAIRARFDLAGAAITGFAPPTPAAAVDDMGAILRIVSALTRATA